LGANDPEGYRKVRTDILKRFRDTNVPWTASHLSYICVVMPSPEEETQTMLRLANFAIGATPSNPRIRGAVNYRAGNYEAAIADLNRSSLVFARRAWDWLFLAMAHHKLGHADEAKNYLQKALEWIDQTERSRATGMTNPWIGWYEAIEVDQLRREAQELIH
jgi:tetratricopeptide (TPR) repeat protein